jgi:predicted protein tyrosine phosphatase
MRMFVVGGRNRLRSPTAEAVWARYRGVETVSAWTSADAGNPLSPDLVEWADVVFVMEKVHRKRLKKTLKSGLRNKKFVVLGIADRYGYMDPALV